MRNVMIVVAVLMISCHVSMLPMRKNDGPHTTINKTQNAKNVARLATSAAQPAKRSKNPTRVDTSLGINTGPLSPSLRVIWPGMYPKGDLAMRTSDQEPNTDQQISLRLRNSR